MPARIKVRDFLLSGFGYGQAKDVSNINKEVSKLEEKEKIKI